MIMSLIGSIFLSIRVRVYDPMEPISISQASHDQFTSEDLVLKLHLVELKHTFVSARMYMYTSRVYIHRIHVQYTSHVRLYVTLSL